MDPVATIFRVVRVNDRYRDPAVDTVETDMEQYRTTRDSSLLRFKAGEKPTWFVLRRMKASFVLEALDSFEGSSRIAVAVRAGVVAIELPDGQRIEPKSHSSGAYETSIADASWLDQIAARYGIETVRELGRLVIEHSALGEGARGPLYS
jgi:hypothetical protein